MTLNREKKLVVCSSPNGRGIAKYAEYLGDLVNGTLVTCDKKTHRFVLWEVFGIVRYAEELRGAREVIFANTRVSPLLWKRLDWRRVTVVVHDVMDTDAERVDSRHIGICREIRGRVIRRVNSWVMKKSIEKANRVIFNSQYTKSEVKRWIGHRHAISCVISPPPSFEKKVVEMGCDLEIDSERRKPFKMLAISGTSKNKAHETYMSFHRELEARIGESVGLVIYGIELSKTDSQFRSWVEREKDRVEIKYRRNEEELLRDYLECDFVVSLSKEEGYGMPIADAIGFGIPVVAMSIESYREIKVDLDNSGIMFLANSLCQCVDNAASLISRGVVRTGKNERLQAYRLFCNKKRDAAMKALRSMSEAEE